MIVREACNEKWPSPDQTTSIIELVSFYARFQKKKHLYVHIPAQSIHIFVYVKGFCSIPLHTTLYHIMLKATVKLTLYKW